MRGAIPPLPNIYSRRGASLSTRTTLPLPLLDGGEWSTSRPGHFTPRERAPGTHWVGS
jgi:hypothetical protein